MNYFIEAAEAKRIIEENIFKASSIQLPLLGALGFYSSQSIEAPINVPSFDNSAMDGYGFHFSDGDVFSKLRVIDEIPAGPFSRSLKLKEGEAVRIFTGAKVPQEVDTVIMQEKVQYDGDYITFDPLGIRKGDNIRLKGSQTKKGDCILSGNTLITSSVIGFLAGFGIDTINVFSPLKLGLLITGNELVEIGNPLTDGKIYNSNQYMLQAALAEIHQSFCFAQHVKDTFEDTFSAVQKSIDEVDVLLITGGISVGDYDYVKASLEQTGVEILFYKIRQKPGKPLLFGKLGKKYVFALPGNPASVFSCYHQYVKPFLLGLAGRTNFYEEQDWAVSETYSQKKSTELTQFLKAYHHHGKVTILNAQESYKMNSAAQSNCLVEFAKEKTEINIGEKIKIWKM
ncbi:molybdopterin molybdotransferase MoeA [Chryseobacterium aurantiacum]|uniref:molybdopterin molybdotransferase MoeA n=1 Tax=Chryseobacterium aurantiacum TaxID=2116499 RepID=UPI000D134BE6|nr:molybdopterin molybdotransferase MoeA [Chryseobacterium aurantiacum]